MKRLVYIVLMLICMVEGVKGTERLDSILHQYMLHLEADEDPYVFKYAIHVVSLVGQTQDKELAQAYLKKLRQHMKRKDIPFVNLIEGDIWMQMHQPDSAMKHYQIAADGTNRHLASIAYERKCYSCQWNKFNSTSYRQKYLKDIHNTKTVTDQFQKLLLLSDGNFHHKEKGTETNQNQADAE